MDPSPLPGVAEQPSEAWPWLGLALWRSPPPSVRRLTASRGVPCAGSMHREEAADLTDLILSPRVNALTV